MSEADFLAQVCGDLDAAGLRWHHCGDSRYCEGPPGFPDLLAVGPGGVLPAELKAHGRTVSREQWAWSFAFAEAGLSYAHWRERDRASGVVAAEITRLRGIPVRVPPGVVFCPDCARVHELIAAGRGPEIYLNLGNGRVRVGGCLVHTRQLREAAEEFWTRHQGREDL